MLYLQLSLAFVKIGLFSIGGGLATLPFLYALSDQTAWFTHADVINLIAISESTPGPIGINAATYVGYLVGGLPGGVVATLSLVLPSFVIVVAISRVLAKFRDSRLVNEMFGGLRPASTGLIAMAGFLVVRATFWNNAAEGFIAQIRRVHVGMAVVLFYLTRRFDKHPVFYIALSAAAGVVLRMAR